MEPQINIRLSPYCSAAEAEQRVRAAQAHSQTSAPVHLDHSSVMGSGSVAATPTAHSLIDSQYTSQPDPGQGDTNTMTYVTAAMGTGQAAATPPARPSLANSQLGPGTQATWYSLPARSAV